MSLQDRIRKFIRQNYVEPARRRGEQEVAMIAGDVHCRMRLNNITPGVCGALRSSKLQEDCDMLLVEEIRRPNVKKDSPTNKYVFRLVDSESLVKKENQELSLSMRQGLR